MTLKEQMIRLFEQYPKQVFTPYQIAKIFNVSLQDANAAMVAYHYERTS